MLNAHVKVKHKNATEIITFKPKLSPTMGGLMFPGGRCGMGKDLCEAPLQLVQQPKICEVAGRPSWPEKHHVTTFSPPQLMKIKVHMYLPSIKTIQVSQMTGHFTSCKRAILQIRSQ